MAGIAIANPGASRVTYILIFDFRHAQSCRFCFVWNSVHILYHLHSRMEALAAVKKHEIGTENETSRSKSHRNAHETHSIFNVVPGEHNVSGAGLTPRTARVL